MAGKVLERGQGAGGVMGGDHLGGIGGDGVGVLAEGAAELGDHLVVRVDGEIDNGGEIDREAPVGDGVGLGGINAGRPCRPAVVLARRFRRREFP